MLLLAWLVFSLKFFLNACHFALFVDMENMKTKTRYDASKKRRIKNSTDNKILFCLNKARICKTKIINLKLVFLLSVLCCYCWLLITRKTNEVELLFSRFVRLIICVRFFLSFLIMLHLHVNKTKL